MSEKCSRCKETKENVKFYSADTDDLTENISDGQYCLECIEELKEEWWEEESKAYCDGNCDDCDDFVEGDCGRGLI